jgi:hypothetical protein
MSTTHALLFNFQPKNVGVASSPSYTVPSGFYSYVNLTNAKTVSLNSVSIYEYPDTGAIVVDLWVPSGSVLSFASGTISYQEFANTY